MEEEVPEAKAELPQSRHENGRPSLPVQTRVEAEEKPKVDPVMSKPMGGFGKPKGKKKWEFPQLPKPASEDISVSNNKQEAAVPEKKPGAEEVSSSGNNKMAAEVKKAEVVQPQMAMAGEKTAVSNVLEKKMEGKKPEEAKMNSAKMPSAEDVEKKAKKVFNFNKIAKEVEEKKEPEKKAPAAPEAVADPTDPFAKFDSYDPLAKYRVKKAKVDAAVADRLGGETKPQPQEEKKPLPAPAVPDHLKREPVSTKPEIISIKKPVAEISKPSSNGPVEVFDLQEVPDKSPAPAKKPEPPKPMAQALVKRVVAEEKKEGIDILAFLGVGKDVAEEKKSEPEKKAETKKEAKQPPKNALADLEELEML